MSQVHWLELARVSVFVATRHSADRISQSLHKVVVLVCRLLFLVRCMQVGLGSQGGIRTVSLS